MLNSRIQTLLASECISFLSKTLYFHGVNFLQEWGGGGRVRAMTAEWQLEVKWFLIRELSTLAVFVSCYKRTELDADMPASLSFLVCTDGLHLFLLRKTFVLFCFYLGRFRLTKILAKNKQSKRGEWNTSISFSFPAWISFPLYLLYLGSDLFENIARKDNSLEAKKLYEFLPLPAERAFWIDHFRITLCLCLKTRLHAKPSVWRCVWIP